MRTLRTSGALALAACLALWTPATASAIEPPRFDPALDIAPPDGVPAPPEPMKVNTECQRSLVLDNTQLENPPAGVSFGTHELHKFATGAGQKVAVIDSGVNPNVRLPNLTAGGDYIMGGDDGGGLHDCDHHGTLVAGIIGAASSPADRFVGVAPDAEIVAIRQSSNAYTQADYRGGGRDEDTRAAGSVLTMAQAIVHAADMGATVINLSVTSCVKANAPVDLHALAGAVHYAAVERNVVLVAAAGNASDGGGRGNVGAKCEKNPIPPIEAPDDDRGWGNVTTLSLPSLYSQYVLSVGGTDSIGDPYANTMTGPWVGVAAPAVNIVSLNPAEGERGTLVDGQLVDNKPTPLNGTSFSSAYIAGLAALIRQKYPQLSAAQVIRRITYTAHTPARNLTGMLGFGVVDAKAALTAEVAVGEWHAPSAAMRTLPPPPPPPIPDTMARDVGFAVAGGMLALAAVVLVIQFARRH